MVSSFSGSKLALFFGEKLLVYLRDERDGLLYSGMWDLPGGGREGNESAEACVLRELDEEFGLKLSQPELTYKSHQMNKRGNRIYFFAAQCDKALVNKIQFGDEGQFYKLVDAREFLEENNAIPHLQEQLKKYLSRQ